MLWALERAYLDAWSFAAPGAGVYRDFVAHWTTPQFAAYVSDLAAAADDTAGRGADLDTPFVDVVEAEAQFWDMAYEGAS
jgi:thiaminase/transcriptional activator TenA